MQVLVDSDYTANTSIREILVDSTLWPVAITIPPTALVGFRYTIKDHLGTSGINPITVTSPAGIDGQASFVIDIAFRSIDILFNGIDWVLL